MNGPILPWVIAAAALPFVAGTYWPRPAREEQAIRSVIPAPEQSIYCCQGDDAGPAVLSPDGKRLAFTAARRDGKVTLWVRALDSVAGQSLAGTEGAILPFWSPNSQAATTCRLSEWCFEPRICFGRAAPHALTETRSVEVAWDVLQIGEPEQDPESSLRRVRFFARQNATGRRDLILDAARKPDAAKGLTPLARHSR